jgi:GDP-L-fucose synthase
VLPALIRKAHEALTSQERSMTVWGTGNPRRELMCSDDLAEACLLLMTSAWGDVTRAVPDARLPLLNVGTGEDISIAELALLVCDIVGYDGELAWDLTKPDGTPQKLLDVSRMKSLGWRPRTALSTGIRIAYEDFLSRK